VETFYNCDSPGPDERRAGTLLRQWAPEILSCLVGIVLIYSIPIGDALEFNADEGYGLERGFLLSRGHPLFREIWSDQPPLHAAMLALLFRGFGPSVFAARISSVVFACILIWLLMRLGSLQGSLFGGIGSAGLLVCSPEFLDQGVSAMPELPAMSLGLLGTFLLLLHLRTHKLGFLLISAAGCGLAVQTKGSALLYLPAIFVAIFSTQAYRMRPVLVACIWISVFSLVVVAVKCFFPGESLFSLTEFHFQRAIREAFRQEGIYLFEPKMLVRDLPLFLMAAVGVAIAFCRRSRQAFVPIAVFLTAVIAHLSIAPFWSWYYLHFSVPLAWMAGSFVAMLAVRHRKISRAGARNSFKVVFACVMTAVLIVDCSSRAWRGITSLQDSPKIISSPIVAIIRRYMPVCHWIYADRVIYAFHSGVEVPPWSCVLSKKRIIAHSLNSKVIAGRLASDRPPLLLLETVRCEDLSFKRFLDSYYVPIFSGNGLAVFLESGLFGR
jgi:Dolichyl-phosphate-mannose-protein mannosyltransferase